ncbi:MAG: hypothetical protein WDM96_09290 [Lacunisphaera sp.]
MFDVRLLQVGVERLHLDEDGELAVHLHRQIAVRALDLILGSDLGIFIVAEEVGEDVFHERRRIGFADVTRLRLFDQRLIALESLFDAALHLRGDLGHGNAGLG